mgnify:CR=1 FL=1|jgi:hypothetical protein
MDDKNLPAGRRMGATGRDQRCMPLLAALISVVLVAAWVAPATAEPGKPHPGIVLYKTVGCMACHKWHGMGGSGYGGTPINFRETFLDRNQLIEVVSCGRPGTGMPAYHKEAYRGYDCYDGLTPEDLEELMPGRPPRTLSRRQIKHIADFIVEHFKGRSNEVVESDCRIFFGESRMCKNLKLAVGSNGGGGGH